MRVFITGGTGTIGRGLVRALHARGDQAVVLTRRIEQARRISTLGKAQFVQGDPTVPGSWELAVNGCDAVVNLAGQNIFAKRWTAEEKHLLEHSRVRGTENVVSAIAAASQRPKVLVQGCAIGYYGPHGDETLTETSPPGDDFMARLCQKWEAASLPVEGLGVRLARVRTGVVLEKGEGVLGTLTPVFRWVPFGAAPIGSGEKSYAIGRGQQWMSWIHHDDIVGILMLALDHSGAQGPMNGTAPQPERNVDFSRALAKALGRRRVFVPFGPPDVMMKLVLGEVAEVVTKGQRVLPAKAQELGYQFRFPSLAEALGAIFGGTSNAGSAKEPALSHAPAAR
jgi:uncharacterized protein (TIGR01777 family)